MWKLIKMDFYRLFHGKAIKVGAIAAFLMCMGYMFISLGLVALSKLAFKEDPMVAMQLGAFLHQIDWINGVNFSEVVFGATSALALFIGCIISANFIGSEQSCGYTKNYAGQLPNKGYIAISKFVVTSSAQILILVIYTVVSTIFTGIIFGKYINGYDIKNLLLALGLRLLLHLAINAVIIFLCMLTKSHAVAMVAGCVFGTGVTKFIYLIAGIILDFMKIKLPIIEYMPDGINGQLSLSTAGELTVKAVAVSVAFIAVFVAANYVVMRKRDVK